MPLEVLIHRATMQLKAISLPGGVHCLIKPTSTLHHLQKAKMWSQYHWTGHCHPLAGPGNSVNTSYKEKGGTGPVQSMPRISLIYTGIDKQAPLGSFSRLVVLKFVWPQWWIDEVIPPDRNNRGVEHGPFWTSLSLFPNAVIFPSEDSWRSHGVITSVQVIKVQIWWQD